MRSPINPSRLRAAAIAAVACAALAAPATAGAASVNVGLGKLTFSSAPGEDNDVTVAPVPSGFAVTESGTKAGAPVPFTAGPGCTLDPSGRTATCTGAISSLKTTLGDGTNHFDSTAVALSSSVDGGAGADYIYTGAGADAVNAFGGDDQVDAGYGQDTIVGGPGFDLVAYTSHSTPVTVTLDGVANDGSTGENDTVSADVEFVLGGSGDDTIVGNSGANFLSGGLGNDTITGGGGDDTLGYWERSDPITIDFSTHTFGDVALGEHDTVTDTIENAVGGTGDDRLIGDAAANRLWGGYGTASDGDDWFQGRGGSDSFVGDGGTDTVDYSDRVADAPVTVTLDGLPNDGTPGENDSVGLDIENVTGGAGDDTITGNGGDNVLSGGGGADTLTGAAGNDTLAGDAGDDDLSGGANMDSLDGGPGTDALDAGDGDDAIAARDGEADTVVCGNGADDGLADRVDTIAADCEGVNVPAPASDPPADPPADGGTTPDPVVVTDPPAGPADPLPAPGTKTDPPATTVVKKNSVPPAIPQQTASVTGSGVALVQIVCPAGSGGCSGTVELELPVATKATHAKIVVAARRRVTRIGRTKFSAKAGTKPVIHVRLSKRGRQRILRHVRRTRGRVKITTRSADGRTVVRTQSITLRPRRQVPPKRTPPKHGRK